MDLCALCFERNSLERTSARFFESIRYQPEQQLQTVDEATFIVLLLKAHTSRTRSCSSETEPVSANWPGALLTISYTKSEIGTTLPFRVNEERNRNNQRGTREDKNIVKTIRTRQLSIFQFKFSKVDVFQAMPNYCTRSYFPDSRSKFLNLNITFVNCQR